jgi:hypothetical protein
MVMGSETEFLFPFQPTVPIKLVGYKAASGESGIGFLKGEVCCHNHLVLMKAIVLVGLSQPGYYLILIAV